MASFRLTTSYRDSIVHYAIEGAFAERDKALAEREHALARRCYDAVIPAAEQRLAAKMPEHWLRRDACLRFNVGGLTVDLRTADGGLPVPYRPKGEKYGGYSCNRLGAVSDPDIVQDVNAYLADVEALKKTRAEAKAALRGMLAGVNTIKVLAELWPEGRPYYERYMVERPAPNLPAPQIAAVNALLGLAEAA